MRAAERFSSIAPAHFSEAAITIFRIMRWEMPAVSG